jgi:hypothetical protein
LWLLGFFGFVFGPGLPICQQKNTIDSGFEEREVNFDKVDM